MVDLVKPDIGLLFWMVVSFGIVLLLLKKFAWSTILRMLKEREQSIDDALHAAENARAEMASMHVDNERILAEVQQKRTQMLREAQDIKERILAEAKQQAIDEQQKMLAETQRMIEVQKNQAMEEIRRQIAGQAVSIARQLLRKELAGDQAQQDLIEACLDDYTHQS